MEKSYNDIKTQEQRVLALCAERGRYCDNAKNRLDTQRVAQITRNALTQHGFPIFGQFDKDEKHACVHREQPKSEPVAEEAPKTEPAKVVRQTPTEKADNRMALNDWMDADEKNRRKIQEIARHQYMNRMYAELLFDMQVCKMEGWDVFEYPRMIRDAIARLLPPAKQLTLQFT